MAYTTYNKIWKWIIVNWTLMQDFYGADFNPTNFVFPSWDSVSAYQETTNFNLSWFQPWHEVWCAVLTFAPEWWTGTLYGDFYRDWVYWWYTSRYVNDSSAAEWCVYMYFWVDKDEIRPWYSNYYIHYYSTDWVIDFTSPTFTASDLSIDSTLHKSWFLWVSWNNICYTDNAWDEIWQDWYWYKHKIAYDSWYSSFVWASHAGSLWLDSDDNLRIYYVDEQWYKRRTYMSDERYWGDVNIWPYSSRRWSMRVWVSSAEYWYWYLCFIAPNWSKRRILNWPPAWYQ